MNRGVGVIKERRGSERPGGHGRSDRQEIGGKGGVVTNPRWCEDHWWGGGGGSAQGNSEKETQGDIEEEGVHLTVNGQGGCEGKVREGAGTPDGK